MIKMMPDTSPHLTAILRRKIVLAAIAITVAAITSAVLVLTTASTAQAQGTSDILTYAEAKEIVADCYQPKIISVKLADGSELERMSLPHDYIGRSFQTPYGCAWEKTGAYSGVQLYIAYAHIREALGDAYLEQGDVGAASHLFFKTGTAIRFALERLHIDIQDAASRLELVVSLGETLRRAAAKENSISGADGPIGLLVAGETALRLRLQNESVITDTMISEVEEQIDQGFTAGAIEQAITDTLSFVKVLALKGHIDTALALMTSTADRLGGHVDAPRLYVQASDLASRNRQCGLAEELWRQATVDDSTLGDYSAWPACRDLEDDPVLAPDRDVSGKIDENRVGTCVNSHRNSTAENRSGASADIQRAQCLVLEASRIDIEDGIALLNDARGLAAGDIPLQAITYATAGDLYGRDGQNQNAVAAYQAAAETMLTATSAEYASTIGQFGGSVSLNELVAPVAPHRQAATYYRSAAAQAFNAGVPIRQALMLELAGETLRELGLDLQRPAGYSDEDFDSLKDILLEASRNDLHPAARIYRDRISDFGHAADLFLKALELDTEILPILTRKGQTSQSLFSLSAFLDLLEDSPDGALNIYARLAEAELIATSFTAKPEALQPNVARQARRFFAGLAMIARDRLDDHFLAEQLYGLAGAAIVRPIDLETNDWNTARAEYNNAGRQAEEYGSCERATEWYEKAAEAYSNTSPNATANKCSRDSFKYGEGVPISLVSVLDALGEVIDNDSSAPPVTQPTATPLIVRATPTATPVTSGIIEDAVIKELSPPSEGSGGSCNAPNDGRVSAGQIGLLALPLGLLFMRLWRRRTS